MNADKNPSALLSAFICVHLRFLAYPRSNASTAWGAELACARAAMPDCRAIDERVRFAASTARSASRIRLCAADRLLICVLASPTENCNRFWPFPTTACAVPSKLTAAVSSVTAVDALPWLVMSATLPPEETLESTTVPCAPVSVDKPAPLAVPTLTRNDESVLRNRTPSAEPAKFCSLTATTLFRVESLDCCRAVLMESRVSSNERALRAVLSLWSTTARE